MSELHSREKQRRALRSGLLQRPERHRPQNSIPALLKSLLQIYSFCWYVQKVGHRVMLSKRRKTPRSSEHEVVFCPAWCKCDSRARMWHREMEIQSKFSVCKVLLDKQKISQRIYKLPQSFQIFPCSQKRQTVNHWLNPPHRNGANLFQFNTQLSSDISRCLILETEFFPKVRRKEN